MTKKILFVLPNLKSGGAERTILNVLNFLDRSKFSPHLALFKNEGQLLSLLNDDVRLHNLNCSRARYSIFRLSKLIQTLKPDLILSTIRYVNALTVVSKFISRTDVPIILRETNNFTAAGVSSLSISERLVGYLYRRADVVLALSKGVRHEVTQRYGLDFSKTRVIYNPIYSDQIKQMANDTNVHSPLRIPDKNNKYRIIAVGHFKFQKGFDLLIQAVGRLRNEPCHLVTVGDGVESNNLKNLTIKLDLQDKVFFVGYQDNPYAWMKTGDLFVLSSRWEGFGHVIAEAMVCGVPVLATRCPSGPDEIIQDNVSGLLCESESIVSLANGIHTMLCNEDMRFRFSVQAKTNVTRFDTNSITREYENLILEVTDHNEIDSLDGLPPK